MDVDGVPNVRVCTAPAAAGMAVQHQNAFPSLEFDLVEKTQKLLSPFMPVGWYYKIFRNRRVWNSVEPAIRRAAGVGAAPPTIDEVKGEFPSYEHAYLPTDLAVVGAGPAGLGVAIERAREGARVTLIDDQPSLGGHLRYKPGNSGRLQQLIGEVETLTNIEVLSGCSCFGLYEGNTLGVLQPRPDGGVRERLIQIRARHVTVATGVYETPLLFNNNDLVGVMLSSAVERLIRLYGISPGTRAVVAGEGPRSDEISALLLDAGVEVAAVVVSGEIIGGTGRGRVTGVHTTDVQVPCDLLVMCGPQVPNAGLLHQAGAKLEWDERKGAFVPTNLPAHVTAAGEVTGEGLTIQSPQANLPDSKRCFVCLCEDVTTHEIRAAIREGFDQIETLKRYTTVSMGPCQGRYVPAFLDCGLCQRDRPHHGRDRFDNKPAPEPQRLARGSGRSAAPACQA